MSKKEKPEKKEKDMFMEALRNAAIMMVILPMIMAYVAGGFGKLVAAFTEKMPENATNYQKFGEAVD